MRLIDADSIIAFVNAGYLINPSALSWSDNDVVDMIESRPTIDAVPVKHGEWSAYDVSGYRKCSMCGGYVNWNPKPFLFGDGEYNYCPNCGADMRERKDDERTDENQR